MADLRVAAIVDEFTEACLAPEADLLNLDARTWRIRLPLFRPDLLFVESTWRGRRGSWQRKVASYEGHSDNTLRKVVAFCRRRGIPTAFWNKEDPVHYDRFLASARLFDFVFTTDADRVPHYERDCGVPAHPLLFAAQPALHFPGMAKRQRAVCYAGSYGEPEFAQRRVDLEVLLDAAAEHRLVILDRNNGPHKAFPPRFRSYRQPPVGYRDLASEYRRYSVFLNVNTVRDSPTMFARRVFELLACGTSVVSGPSLGMERMFGDVVAVASTPDGARAAITRFLEDQAYRDENSARGMEMIARAHTYAHRVSQLCEAIGLEPPTRR